MKIVSYVDEGPMSNSACNSVFYTFVILIVLTLFGLGFFGVPGPGGGGGGGGSKAPPPLHKSENIDAIDMKLGG